VVHRNGNVGIGTTNPQAKLDISNSTNDVLERINIGSSGGNSAWLRLTETNFCGGFLRYDNATNNFHIGVHDVNDTDVANDIVAITVDRGSGNVGIGDTTPDVALDVIGDINYTGTITDVSDERLKENIEVITDSIEKLKYIKGIYFNMIGSDKRELGVIAQNVQKVLPEAVSVINEEKGYLGVSYTSLVPVLIEAIKELKEEYELLRKRVEALELR